MFETRIWGLGDITVSGNFPAVRYWRITAGAPDFNNWYDRYKQLLKRVARKSALGRNYPCNLELLHMAGGGGGGGEFPRRYDACALQRWDIRRYGSGIFLLHSCEMGNLRILDAHYVGISGGLYLDLFHAGWEGVGGDKPTNLINGDMEGSCETLWGVSSMRKP